MNTQDKSEKEISAYNFICRSLSNTPGTPYAFQNVYEAGRRDVSYILWHDELSLQQKEKLALKLTAALMPSVEQGEVSRELNRLLYALPMFFYISALSKRLKILLGEGLFQDDTLLAFGIRLAKESSESEEVKLGILILGLFENDITQSILRTLTLHSEFAIFGLEAASDWHGYNRLVFDIAKNSTGYGKLAALHILKPITAKQQKWMFEEGMSNFVAKQMSAIICLEKADMQSFYESAIVTKGNFRIFSRLIAYASEENDVKDLTYSLRFVSQYMDAAEELASEFIDIAAIMMIMKSMKPFWRMSEVDEMKQNGWSSNKEQDIRVKCMKFRDTNIRVQTKSKSLLLNEMDNPQEDNSLIVATIKALEYGNVFMSLNFEAFIPMLDKDGFDMDVMEYMLIDHPEQYAGSIYEYLLQNSPDEVLRAPAILKEKELTADNKPDFWLDYLLKAMRKTKFSDEAFYLRCLHARYQNVRIEAITCLRAIKGEWSEAVTPALEKAFDAEPDEKIKRRIRRLLGARGKVSTKEQRYVDISYEAVKPTSADITLLYTTIAGAFYRDMSVVQDQLSYGDTLFLKREPENQYDSNAILITAEDGYVLGYVPRTENAPLVALMDAGEKLYAILHDVLEDHGGKPEIEIKKSRLLEKSGNIIQFPIF